MDSAENISMAHKKYSETFHTRNAGKSRYLDISLKKHQEIAARAIDEFSTSCSSIRFALEMGFLG